MRFLSFFGRHLQVPRPQFLDTEPAGLPEVGVLKSLELEDPIP